MAPLKNFKERPKEISPWEDQELLEKLKARDFYYFKYKDSNYHDDYAIYSKLRSECQSLNRRNVVVVRA